MVEHSKAFSVLGHIVSAHINGHHTESLPPVDDMLFVVTKAAGYLKSEKNIIYLEGDFEVVGDIHGDLNSLLTVFELKGYPPNTKYIFLGDYVDRGAESVEVVLVLLALKCLFPNQFFLLRGNHELSNVCKKYDFRNDCIERVDHGFYRTVMRTFAHLPLGAVINNDIFCVHGGIPQTDMLLEEINEVSKPVPRDYRDIMTEMLWSDPRPKLRFPFEANTARGAGNFFNAKALDAFFERNGLSYLIRAHEVCPEGFVLPLGADERCVTVFSSADHVNDNLGSVVSVGANKSLGVDTFTSSTAKCFAAAEEFVEMGLSLAVAVSVPKVGAEEAVAQSEPEELAKGHVDILISQADLELVTALNV